MIINKIPESCLVYTCMYIRYFIQKCYILKTFYSEFSYIEVLFTDQNSRHLEIENQINITLVMNLSVKYKNGLLFSSV